MVDVSLRVLRLLPSLKLVTNFYTDQNLNMYIITLKVFSDYLKVSIGVLW